MCLSKLSFLLNTLHPPLEYLQVACGQYQTLAVECRVSQWRERSLLYRKRLVQPVWEHWKGRSCFLACVLRPLPLEDRSPNIEVETYLRRWRLVNDSEHVAHLYRYATSRTGEEGSNSSSGASLNSSLRLGYCKEWLGDWA
jgi:hypothetical protein